MKASCKNFFFNKILGQCARIHATKNENKAFVSLCFITKSESGEERDVWMDPFDQAK